MSFLYLCFHLEVEVYTISLAEANLFFFSGTVITLFVRYAGAVRLSFSGLVP